MIGKNFDKRMTVIYWGGYNLPKCTLEECKPPSQTSGGKVKFPPVYIL